MSSRGRSRGSVLKVRTPLPPEMSGRLSNTTGIQQKKKRCARISKFDDYNYDVSKERFYRFSPAQNFRNFSFFQCFVEKRLEVNNVFLR